MPNLRSFAIFCLFLCLQWLTIASVQWLTISEACLELRLSRITVLRLLRQGVLLGVRTDSRNPKKNSQWRIYPPSEKMKRILAEQDEHHLHVPLFTAQEVGKVLGIQACTVRKFVQLGRLHQVSQGPGLPSLFTAAEVRRFIWYRERLHRQGRKIYSPWLVKFLTAVLQAETAPAVQQLEWLVAQVMTYLPGEEREALLPNFWKALEQINEVLRRVRERRSTIRGSEARLP